VPAEIYIFRHGIESKLPEPPGLSSHGIARVRKQARGLTWLDVHLDVIVVGTDVASHQTAAALAGVLTPSPAIIELATLSPTGNVDALLQDLWDTSQTRVGVVGCDPIVGLLAARLIGAHHPPVFKKAAVCRIDVDSGTRCGHLRWFLPPKILREIGR
jgi:phosphohistidine phosphatase SixA